MREYLFPIEKVTSYFKNINSKEDLTGFLNLTMERAPIIPKDKAILPAITLVIAKVIIGKRMRVIVPEKVFIQF